MRSLAVQVFKVFFICLALATFAPEAKAVTGFLKGEVNEGLSKICFYNVLGDTQTINLSSTTLCPLSYDFEQIPHVQPPPSDSGKTGFLQGEKQQGFSKICFYDVLGETYTINI